MPDKLCPNCGLWNTENAIICDCGYNFISETIEKSITNEAEYNRILQKDGKSVLIQNLGYY